MAIIAEIGVNHFGDMDIARELIRQAKACGADLAKFQLYDVDMLFSDKKIMAHGKNWYEDIKPTQLSKEQAKMLFNYGEEIGIEVFFSVFDIERVKWCEEMGVKRYKIAYNQRDNLELVAGIVATGKPFMVSSDKPTIHNTLYCVPKYPTEIEDINWKMMEECDGFSDHTKGIELTKIALARGANIIEKHFCLNREREGVDIPLSITPSELRELVKFEKKVGVCNGTCLISHSKGKFGQFS